MSSQYTKLVEKINRIVRDRGDVELMVLLDKIMDKESETEQAEALGAVVKILNQGKKPVAPVSSSVSTVPSPAASLQGAQSSKNTPAISQTGDASERSDRAEELSHVNQSSEEGA